MITYLQNNDKLIIVAAEGITSVDADVSMHQRDENSTIVIDSKNKIRNY